jgi:hypothetical protein
MKSYQAIRQIVARAQTNAGMVAAATLVLGFLASPSTQAATNIVIWDTGSPLAELAAAEDRSAWKPVPTELFAFEKNPAKAASDPGYYGREHVFTGDAVVENQCLTAVFWSKKGRVALYAKPLLGLAPESSAAASGLGTKIVEFAAPTAPTAAPWIGHCEILRNASDEATLRFSFAAGSHGAAGEPSADFSFGRNEIVEIKPGAKLKEMSLLSPLDYAIVPGFVGDDLIFDAVAYPSNHTLHLPAENLLVGLLQGEASMMMMSWPKGNQQVKLRLGKEQEPRRLVEGVEFGADGQSFYVAGLAAPGLWHREELKAAHLEKDVASDWRRPFPAKWKTQLSEAGVKTTYAFRPAKGDVWRGVPGSYQYPVWFDGEQANYHLSKKVPPTGESIVYFIEGRQTPLSIPTPAEFLKATLGRSASETIMDPLGRKLRTHHRRAGEGVHRACTCGCTEAIQAFFEAGEEVAKKGEIKEALGDMIYFVDCHVERIDEYRRFAEELTKFLQQQAASAPASKSFLDTLEQAAQRILEEQSVQKENMKTPEHKNDLARQTMALTGSKGTNNLNAYMDLLKAWRAMGGAQDYVVAQCHTLTRKLEQDAGYGCVEDADTAAMAKAVRARCRQCLRNPDGYEIWADY